MALTSILAPVGDRAIFTFARGNVGVLEDIVARTYNVTTLPSLGGACDYPSEDDVRLGIVYSTFTGNLELPAETDVLTGIQYGTNGTEFTGTATGGGGSEEIILNVTKGKLLKRMTDKLYFDL